MKRMCLVVCDLTQNLNFVAPISEQIVTITIHFPESYMREGLNTVPHVKSKNWDVYRGHTENFANGPHAPDYKKKRRKPQEGRKEIELY